MSVTNRKNFSIAVIGHTGRGKTEFTKKRAALFAILKPALAAPNIRNGAKLKKTLAASSQKNVGINQASYFANVIKPSAGKINSSPTAPLNCV